MNGNNKRKGHVVLAIDKDFARELEMFKKQLEEKLGRNVSMPFATNLLYNIFPKDINVSNVWVNDKSRRDRTVEFQIEYLMEEI